MKAILQYSSTQDDFFQNCGVIRMRDKSMQIIPITKENINGENEIIGYRINIRAKMIELNQNFLNSNKYYFKLYFNKDSKEILLGERYYSIEIDHQINKNKYSQYLIKISFLIRTNELNNYLPQDIQLIVMKNTGVLS